jgi:hypothetical protein
MKCNTQELKKMLWPVKELPLSLVV